MSQAEEIERARRQELHLAAAIEREWEKMCRTHVCAECGQPLVMPHDPEKGGRILVCGTDRGHQGFQRVTTWWEAYRDGEEVPMHIADHFRREGGERPMESTQLQQMTPDRMLKRMEGARFPQQMNGAERRNLAELAIYYGLDPAFGELMLYQGRPYISIDGRRRKALETGLLDGMSTRPATKEEREAWGVEKGDYLWFCDVYRQGCQRPFTAHGRVRLAETGPPKDKSKAGYRPLEVDPQTMAAKRAEGRALKMAFADSISLPSIEGVGDVEDDETVVEGEARELPPPDIGGENIPPTDRPAERPSATAHREGIRSDRREPDTEPEAETGSQLPVVDPEKVDHGTGEIREEKGPGLPMETLQDLYTAGQSVYGVHNWSEILIRLGLSSKSQIADIKDAWLKLQRSFAESGEAASAKSDTAAEPR